MFQPLCLRLIKTTTSFLLFALLLSVTVVMSGCGQRPTPRPMPAQLSEESFTQIGNYQLHYNAVLTTDLPPEAASSYGIQRSKNRALLNISVLYREVEQTAFKPIAADVSVQAYNLVGQSKPIAMQRVDVGDSISYIGEFSISDRETVMFDIKAAASATGAMPTQSSQTLVAKFKHEFFID